MSIQQLGKVKSSNGRTRKVSWDEKSGEVYVDGRNIGVTTKNKGDVMEFARGWLDSNPSR
ncbi:MAG: hypothetical protein H6843_13970 [Rhodospirillaceae bacterium]|nr:hypothetical protein [Rhodospirillaceae bacterium]